jgi:hypothetical protein
MRRHFFTLTTNLMVFVVKNYAHKFANDTALAFCHFLRQRVPTAKIGRHYLPGSSTKEIFELHIGNMLSVRHLKEVNDHNASFCLLAICAHFFFSPTTIARSSTVAASPREVNNSLTLTQVQ